MLFNPKESQKDKKQACPPLLEGCVPASKDERNCMETD
jgi:hypothetical protein